MTNNTQQNYTRIVEEAGALAKQLERGQAEAPISLLFDKLATENSKAELVAVLLPFSNRSLASTLSWLVGPLAAAPLLLVLESIGVVELAIGGSNWALQSGARHYQAFDSCEAWTVALRALAKEHSPQSRTGTPPPPISLQLPGAGGLQPVRLQVLAAASVLNQQPGLLARLCTSSHLGILAGDMHYILQDADRTALNMLAENLPALWSVMTVDELEEDTKPQATGWWAQFRSSQQHLVPKPVVLTTHIKAGLAALLTDLTDTTRQNLLMRQASRSLANAIALLTDQHDQRLRQATTRLEREQRSARAQEPDSASTGRLRQMVQEGRQMLQDHGPTLARLLGESARQQRGETGQFGAQLGQYLAGLSPDDLHQDGAHSQIKLTLDPRYLENLNAMVRNAMQQDCQALTVIAQGELDTLSLGLHKSMRSVDIELDLSSASLLSKEIWAPIGEQLELKINYKGTMPKRGILDRFKEGRQGAMGFMMMGSMAAMVFGGNLRDTVWFGPSIGIIFVGSMAYSIVSWKSDDAERIALELERVRESLQAELQRVLTDIRREITARIQDAAERQRKLWQRALDGQFEASQKHSQAELDMQKRAQQDRQRVAEKQRNELDGLRSGIARLKREAATLEQGGA